MLVWSFRSPAITLRRKLVDNLNVRPWTVKTQKNLTMLNLGELIDQEIDRAFDYVRSKRVYREQGLMQLQTCLRYRFRKVMIGRNM